MVFSLNFVQNFEFNSLKFSDRAILLSAIASNFSSDSTDNHIPDLVKFISEHNFSEEILTLLFSQYTESIYEVAFRSGRSVRENTEEYFSDVEFAPNPGMNRVPDYDRALVNNPLPFVQKDLQFTDRYLEALKLQEEFSDPDLQKFANRRAIQFERFALKYHVSLQLLEVRLSYCD